MKYLIFLFTLPLIASTVNCNNNSGDLALIQSAINAGGIVTIIGTCSITGGTITISNPVIVQGLNIPVVGSQGAPSFNAVVNGNGANNIFAVNSNNTTIQYLTFNAGGIQTLNVVSNFSFINNTVQNVTTLGAFGSGSGSGTGVMSISGAISPNVSNNIFQNLWWGSWPTIPSNFGFHPSPNGFDDFGPAAIEINCGMKNAIFSNNLFDKTGNDALQGHNNCGSNVLGGNNQITNNTFIHIHRAPIEMQLDLTNSTISGNYIHDQSQPFPSSFAITAPSGGSPVYVINNTALTNQGVAGNGFIAAVVETQNWPYLINGNVGGTINPVPGLGTKPTGWDGVNIQGGSGTSGSILVQNNTFCGSPSIVTVSVEAGYGNPPHNNINNYNNTSSCPTGLLNSMPVSSMAPSLESTSITSGVLSAQFGMVSNFSIRQAIYKVDGVQIGTQQAVDTSMTFASDRKWLYHTTVNTLSYPTGTHNLSATFVDASGVISSPVTTSFSGGTATGPIATITPSNANFGSVPTSTASNPIVINLQNTGSALLSSISSSITGTNPGDFVDVTTCGSTLAVGVSCSYTITFTPGSSGARSATLTISNNASGSPQTVPLSGTGVSSAPAVTLSPTSENFGVQLLTVTSPVKIVTLTNSGVATLTGMSQVISGTNAGDFSISATTCSTSLTASSSCTISLTFTPSAVASRNANLVFTNSASTSPQTVMLSGIGSSGGLPDGTYSITDQSNLCNGLACTFDGGFALFGTNTLQVYQKVPTSYPNQQWQLTTVGSGQTICNLGIVGQPGITNSCLTAPASGPLVLNGVNGSITNNNIFHIYNINGTSNYLIFSVSQNNYVSLSGATNSAPTSMSGTIFPWTFSSFSPSIPILISPASVVPGGSTSVLANQPVTWSLQTNIGGASLNTTGPSTSTTLSVPLGIAANQTMLGCPVLPNDSIFNTKIDNLPVNANNATWTSFITAGISILPSWGTNYTDNSTATYSLKPFYGNGLGDQPSYTVPFPGYATVVRENGAYVAGIIDNDDHHTVTVQKDQCQFYEYYNELLSQTAAPFTTLEACQTTGTDCNLASVIPPYLSSNFQIPSTSTDAAGLPLAPLTWTLADIKAGPKHAARFTQGSFDNCIWPSPQTPGGSPCVSSSSNIPYGARFRLKTVGSGGPNITTVCTVSAVLNQDCFNMLTTLTTYGMMLGDIGGGGQIEVSSDTTKDPITRAAMILIQSAGITGTSFQAVDESTLQETTGNGYQLPGPFGSYAVDPNNSFVTPSNYAKVCANVSKCVSVAIQPISVGLPSSTLTIAQNLGPYALQSWVTPSTQNQAVTWSLSGCGTVSGSNYTPPTSGAPCTATLTVTSVADSAATAKLYVSVFAISNGHYRFDVASINGTTTTDASSNVWYNDFGLQMGGAFAFPNASSLDFPTWINHAGSPLVESTQDGSAFYTYGGDMNFCAVVPNGNYQVRWNYGQGWQGTSSPNGSRQLVFAQAENPNFIINNGTIVAHYFDWFYPIGYQWATPSSNFSPATVTNNQLCTSTRVLAPGVPITTASGIAPLYWVNGTQNVPNFVTTIPTIKGTQVTLLEIIPDGGLAHWVIDSQQTSKISANQNIQLYVVDWYTGDSDVTTPTWSIVSDPTKVASISPSGLLTLGSYSGYAGIAIKVKATGVNHSATTTFYTTGSTYFIN